MKKNDPALSENPEDINIPFVQVVTNEKTFDKECLFVEKALSEEDAWEGNIDNDTEVINE